MYKGTVKWFSNLKGYGFIEYTDPKTQEQQDIFVHFTGIDMDGYKTLKSDQLVTFKISSGNRGPQATQVKLNDHQSLASDYQEEFK